ncbi:ImuA family protein [Antarctobacter jejuensis]|uniref:ImuA family protein n=1 Tax=Antarctobacter jejuensis TaxID=1439938 RepID=UPI003FD3F0F5
MTMASASALLSRRPHSPPPGLQLWGDITLPLARVHEICGQARRLLALKIAAQAEGSVVWITRRHGTDQLNPCGMAGLLNPGDVLFVSADRPDDSLWAMEEALRSGAVPVVVADLAEPPGMTPVRRLHLAAETGTGAGLFRPVGLLLTPGSGGAPGIETRLSCDPAHAPGQEAWKIERLRARMMPPKRWRLAQERLTRWTDPAEA